MAIIRFTEADVMQTTIVETGIYPTEVTEIAGPKASSNGNSNHYWTTFRITDGKYKGKEHKVSFNTETRSTTLLGDMQYFPVSHLLPLACAILKKDKEPFDLDTELLSHQPFDAQWGVATVDGRLINTILAFHPAGYGATAPAF